MSGAAFTLRAYLNLFDDATLRDVVDGKAERLPLDMPLDPPTRHAAVELLTTRYLGKQLKEP